MFKGTQCLVTGGSGFIGRFVVRRLLQQGVAVRLLCREPGRARNLFGDTTDNVIGDLCDKAACQRACHGVQTVIHIGGLYRFGRIHHRSLMEINVTGTDNLLQAGWETGVTRFVHVSTASILATRTGLVQEHDFPSSVPSHQAYRQSKWLGECRALHWASRGLPVVIVSPTVPFGAEDEAPTPSGQMVLDFLQGRFPFSSRTGLNIIHVVDLACGIVAAADRGRCGERYLLGHHNVTLNELLSLFSVCSGKQSPRFCLPWMLVALAGHIGELTGSGRVCRETASHARCQNGYSSQKAMTELGWQPDRPLEQIAHEAVTWFSRRLSQPVQRIADLKLETHVAG